MRHSTVARYCGPVALAAAGLTALTLTGCGSAATTAHVAGPRGALYTYYRSMVGRYYGGMMAGQPGGWMMGSAGYRWMTGGNAVPGWMHGGTWPAGMMGASADPGRFMGRFWADMPGPRVSQAQAASLGSQVPAGARVDRAANVIRFTTADVRFVALASPAGGPDDAFRIAGLVNPRLIVPRGARVSIQVINADPDTAHGLVITVGPGTRSWMPMMTARPAFSGSALWFLGNPTSAGMHAATLTFTASSPGSYRYLCPVPGHARKGMAGTLIVTSAP